MKNFFLIFCLVFNLPVMGKNPYYKLNFLKTNAFFYLKQPSYGHYIQRNTFGNGLFDLSIEKRSVFKNYFGIGLNIQFRNYSLNYPDAGKGQLYKTSYSVSFISYYLKYNFRVDSGTKSNTYISCAIYKTKSNFDKKHYYNDTLPANNFSTKNRTDFFEEVMISPVIGIHNEYKLGDFIYFKSGLEFIPSGSGGRDFKNNSRASINFGIQLRFY